MYYKELEKIEDIAKQLIKEKYEKGYFECSASYVQKFDCVSIKVRGYKKDDYSQRYLANYEFPVSTYERVENKESYIKNVIEYVMFKSFNFK